MPTIHSHQNPRNLQYFCSLYFLPLIVPRNQVYSYTIPIGIKGQKYVTHSYIYELIYIYIYIYNHLCQTYWLPLYTSTNQINKYNNNNNNNNKEKELALLSQSGHSSYHIYIYKCIFFFFPASAADHRSLLAWGKN